MQNFITALKAEHIKKRGTGIYVLSAILGAVSPVLFTIISAFNDDKKSAVLPYNYFIQFIESCFDPFAGFFFPLLIIITVSRITQLDHRNGGWQLMETQPVRKISIYFSKFTVILIANLIAILSLIVFCFLGGWIVTFFTDVPEEASFAFLLGDILLIIARLFLAGLFLTAFQYMISVIMPSFIWSILIGFFLLLLYIFLAAFNVVPDWYPLALLGKLTTYKKGSDLGYWLTYSEIVSVLCSIIALYIGFEWYRHKRLATAFFGTAMRTVKLLAVLVVFGGLVVYMLMPNTMEPYSRTVIAGTIESDVKVDKIYLRDVFVFDTVATIPVKNNEFHYVVKQDIPLAMYQMVIGEAMQGTCILGRNDSMYFNFRKNKNALDSKATGTRLAESQYKQGEGISWSRVEHYLEDNYMIDDPEFFTEQLIDEWREATSVSDKFKTVDNYVPREDFRAINRQLLTIKYLNYWHEFLKKRRALFPGDKTPETAQIREMKKSVPLDDEGLLSHQEYFDYIRERLIEKNEEDLDEDTKAIRAIAALKPGIFKDKMLYWQLKKSIEDASDKPERDKLIAQYAYTFKEKKYTRIILERNKVLENLSSGKPAPLFEAVSLAQKPVSLASLKGKIVVIDVWATWCGPCRHISPYFEKMAIKYKNENVQFVAMSVDKRIDDWYVDAKTKSKSVLQLHAISPDKFQKDYDIMGIPHFILIDAQGNLVSSDMPRPDEDAFEEKLRETLGLKK